MARIRLGRRSKGFCRLCRKIESCKERKNGPISPALPFLACGRTVIRLWLRRHDWGFAAEAVPGRTIPYPRGRVTGGASAVNATIALRGVPADYDEWAALGNDGWGWTDVLPYFRRLEDDPEGSEELHGRGGPVAICRWRRDELIPTQRAFFDVCRRRAFPR